VSRDFISVEDSGAAPHVLRRSPRARHTHRELRETVLLYDFMMPLLDDLRDQHSETVNYHEDGITVHSIGALSSLTLVRQVTEETGNKQHFLSF